jgi:hypothetical protein
LGLNEAEYMVNLIDILAEWRWMAGVSTNGSEDDMAQELALISKFIAENYPTLKSEEYKLAVNMSLTNRLDVDVRTFNVFSPMYVSRILNSYIEHKQKLYREIRIRQERDNERKLLEKQPSQEERMQSMIDMAKYLYEKYQAEGDVKDHFTILFDYLKRNNKLNLSKAQIDEAMQYAKERAKKHEPTTYEKLFNKEDSDKVYLEKMYARNYCIQKLFDEIGVDGVIAKIELNDF